MRRFSSLWQKGFLSRYLWAAGLLLFLAMIQAPAWGEQYEEQKLLPSDGGQYDMYGTSVAVFGEVALIGSPSANNGAGAVYVNRYDVGSGTWNEDVKLVASNGQDYDGFGFSVGFFGDVAIVGAPYANNSIGAAYVFRYDTGSGIWNEEALLLPSLGASDDYFGGSVVISGDVALVGAEMYDDSGYDAGAAYVFRYDSGAGTWSEEARLLASDGQEYAHFGHGLALANDLALIGAPWTDGVLGAVYAFRYDPGSSAWNQDAKLVASDGMMGDSFGASITLSGDFMLIGAEGFYGLAHGSAYFFQYDPIAGTWNEKQRFLPSDGEMGDYFGCSAALAGDLALFGSKIATHDHGVTGAAYSLRYNALSGTWKQQEKYVASDGFSMDELGVSVALSSDFILVGARADDDNGEDSGSAYAFDKIRPFSIDVKINGQDGPLFLSETDTATCTIDIAAGSHAGTPVDVWILVMHRGATGTRRWSCGNLGAPTLKPGWDSVFFTGGLSDLLETPFSVPLSNALGTCSVYLVLDDDPNGLLDIPNVWAFDSAAFVVQP